MFYKSFYKDRVNLFLKHHSFSHHLYNKIVNKYDTLISPEHLIYDLLQINKTGKTQKNILEYIKQSI